MAGFHSYKLLSKTTLIYLFFTLTAFLISAFFLTNEADEYIDKELERRFNHSERKIKWALQNKDLERAQRYAELKPLNQKPDKFNNVFYSDTLISDPESSEKDVFRKKSYYMLHDSSWYHVSIVKSINDFYRLRDDIFEALIPAFFILALSIVSFNYFLSGYFFKPFNKILNHMRAYKVGQKDIDHVQTSTSEFIRMQNLFNKMVNRIDEDYNNLKEYTENMAHEIQTPLTVIRNKAENLLGDEDMMRKHGPDIKIIFDETNYLSRLGQSLNLFTKIENREFRNAREIFTEPVINKHLTAVSDSIQLKNLKVEKHLSSDHTLFLDPILLDILLKNMLRNAIQYASTEGPVVIKSTANQFIFSNYGEPLPFPESKLFIRFQHNSSSKKSLGLGLAIVKKICDLNNLAIIYAYQQNQHIFIIQKQ
jgi:signal transduction histidine kinase